MIIYFSEITGYYEYKNYQKNVMTKEQIEKFENDIKEGKKVNPNNYVLADTTKYNNKLSDVADNLSDGISKIIKGGVNNTFRLISNLTNN
jgi:hypothetical protein